MDTENLRQRSKGKHSSIRSRRERKRLARQLEILESAATIFRRKGFDATRIEEIAEQADVSPGTVYNHFPTKDALLLALANQHRSRTPDLISDLVENPPADPIKAFTQFYAIMTQESLRYLDKVLWRHVHAAATVSGWNQFGSERWLHEQSLIDFQCTMVRSLQRMGSLAVEAPVRPLVEVIHASAFFWWERFIAEDPMTRSGFMANLKRDLGFVLQSAMVPDLNCTKRSEAVRKRRQGHRPVRLNRTSP